MKKLIIAVAAVALTGISFAAVNTNTEAITNQVRIMEEEQDKTPVKAEELPEAVKKVLSSDAYAGTTIKQAFLVQGEKAYYEVELVKEDASTMTVMLDEQGQEVK